MPVRKILFVFLLALVPLRAHAFTEQSVVAIPGFYYQSGPLLKVKDGAVPWGIFATTKEEQTITRHPDRLPDVNLQPKFKEIKKYAGRVVKLYGYMFPLDSGEGQKHFLLGPYAQICPFHFHIRPSLVVEINAAKPVPFDYDPVMVQGTLRLARPGTKGSFYFLDNAVPVK